MMSTLPLLTVLLLSPPPEQLTFVPFLPREKLCKPACLVEPRVREFRF